MKLIVGLGNPGRAYAHSRHNLGFQCINLFARKQGIKFTRRQAKARVGFGKIAGEKVILVKPRTFMNLSGESVGPLVHYYKIDLACLLVVYDDIDLPLGKIRIRENGGPGGHNGMKSIIQHLGSQRFPRLRVGIGPIETSGLAEPSREIRTPGFVLGNFTPEEKAIVAEALPVTAEAIYCIITQGVDAAMNKYNSG